MPKRFADIAREDIACFGVWPPLTDLSCQRLLMCGNHLREFFLVLQGWKLLFDRVSQFDVLIHAHRESLEGRRVICLFFIWSSDLAASVPAAARESTTSRANLDTEPFSLFAFSSPLRGFTAHQLGFALRFLGFFDVLGVLGVLDRFFNGFLHRLLDHPLHCVLDSIVVEHIVAGLGYRNFHGPLHSGKRVVSFLARD